MYNWISLAGVPGTIRAEAWFSAFVAFPRPVSHPVSQYFIVSALHKILFSYPFHLIGISPTNQFFHQTRHSFSHLSLSLLINFVHLVKPVQFNTFQQTVKKGHSAVFLYLLLGPHVLSNSALYNSCVIIILRYYIQLLIVYAESIS